MPTNKVKELQAAKAKLAAVEKSLAVALRKELASLPQHYGYSSLKSFFRAVRAAHPGGSRPARPSRAAKAKGKKPARKARVAITDEMKAELKRLHEEGKTGEEIAAALNISNPSVQNVKKELGLVKHRKKG